MDNIVECCLVCFSKIKSQLEFSTINLENITASLFEHYLYLTDFKIIVGLKKLNGRSLLLQEDGVILRRSCPH